MRNLKPLIFIVLCSIAWCPAFGEDIGFASSYSFRFEGKKTASGEIYHHNSKTAAHRTLPFGTVVRVTRLDNNKSVTVRINDRGPFVNSRITDLSGSAAKHLGLAEGSETKIKIEVIDAKLSGTIQSSNGITGSNQSDEDAQLASKGVETPKTYSNVTKRPTKKVGGHLSNQDYNVSSKGLFTIYHNKPNMKGFAIQVASVNNQENMLKTVASLQGQYFSNIMVHLQPDSGTYKVLMGPFIDELAAKNYQNALKKKRINGFVVDLKSFKQ
jgi:rare lipoprotein A